MGNFQLEDFVAGWIGGERIPGWEGPPEVSALTGQPGPRGRERVSRELRRRSFHAVPRPGAAHTRPGCSLPAARLVLPLLACCRDPGGDSSRACDLPQSLGPRNLIL